MVAKMLKTTDQESNISKSVAKADLINEISVLSRYATAFFCTVRLNFFGAAICFLDAREFTIGPLAD